MSNTVQFTDQRNNIALAKAVLDSDYQIGGLLNNQFQSTHVPFTWSVHAINQPKQINIFAASEEKFFDYRTALLKQMVNSNPATIRASLRDYTDPEEYIRQFAETIFGGKLSAQASAQSPSQYNVNLQNSYNELSNLAGAVANGEAASGYPCEIKNLTCQSYLLKYSGFKDNQEYTVLAAVDFEGFEMSYPNQLNNIFGAMFGGMSNSKPNVPESNVLGHSNSEIVEWGSKFRFLMITPKASESEGARDFLKFVNSFTMDENLAMQFKNLISQRMQQDMMATAQYQAQTQANIAGNMYQQQKLTNMLRANSESISNGIMDSWNRKMASDSRISNNFSEAIRGVNTYTTTDGRNVEVGVSADHVYQNQYGDVYGVSGNAIDDDILNKINWTKLNK